MANVLHLLLLLLLPLVNVSVSGDAILVSIDCGSSEIYVDNNNIGWVGDNLYIQNGESRIAQAAPSSVPHVMSSLRVFSTRKKNCYSIYVGKGEQVLVRASFYYGNYDKKSSPPTFDLHFDGNFWSTVVTTIDSVKSYEAIYVAKMDATSVCVAQTQPNQLPFISAIEVRVLDSSMYNQIDASYALFLRQRTAFGANDTVRYPDDSYDRIWVPATIPSGLTQLTGDTTFIDTGVAEKPPPAVLENAVTTTNVSQSLIFTGVLPTSVEVPVYINYYFVELVELASTDKRSFQLYINNERSSDPIIPIYRTALEMNSNNMTASVNTSISLVPTDDSTLPPFINAIEVFQVSRELTDGTDSNDLDALALLQNSFETLTEWRGDPCLPASFNWDWVACSSDNTPRITALYLSGLGLSGPLPDFSAMDALQTIDMQNNSINGEIPDFLGTLPNLNKLNLADNEFSGPIPSSISKNNKLKLVVSGNPNLCVSGKSCDTSDTETSTYPSDTETSTTSYSGGGKKNKKLPVILGATIPTFFVFWIIVGVLAILRHKRKTAAIAAITAGQINGGGPGKPATSVQAMANEFGVQFAQQFAQEVATDQHEHSKVATDQHEYSYDQDGRAP